MNPFTAVNPFEPELVAARKRAKHLCQQLNALRAEQRKACRLIYQQLFGQASNAYIEPSFYCDYGTNIFLGENFYANHNCVFLDPAEIRIGNNVMCGPGVHIYTTTHPLNAVERASGMEMIAPVTIEDNCWLGGGVILLPGVTIGAGSVIAAGSLVTRSIPAGVLAMGNPCRVVRRIDADD